jgi:hypothetical protein
MESASAPGCRNLQQSSEVGCESPEAAWEAVQLLRKLNCWWGRECAPNLVVYVNPVSGSGRSVKHTPVTCPKPLLSSSAQLGGQTGLSLDNMMSINSLLFCPVPADSSGTQSSMPVKVYGEKATLAWGLNMQTLSRTHSTTCMWQSDCRESSKTTIFIQARR